MKDINEDINNFHTQQHCDLMDLSGRKQSLIVDEIQFISSCLFKNVCNDVQIIWEYFISPRKQKSVSLDLSDDKIEDCYLEYKKSKWIKEHELMNGTKGKKQVSCMSLESRE